MVIIRLLLLTVGLTLSFLVQAVEWPNIISASADKVRSLEGLSVGGIWVSMVIP